jgi:ankyrin repeat protein
VIKLLLKNSANLEPKDSRDWRLLSQVAINGHEVVIKLLLNGADLESRDSSGLRLVAIKVHEVVRLLLENGANLELKDRDSMTPLSWAAMKGHEAVVKLLLEKGAKKSY